MAAWKTYSRSIMAVATLLVVAACGGAGGILPSTVYELPYKAPPNAPQEYKLGWEHGCKSGFSAYGNTLYKTFYQFTQDISMIKNPTYYKAWSDSFHYCRTYLNRYLGGYGGRQIPDGEVSPIFDNKTITVRPAFDLRDNSPALDKGMTLGVFDGLEVPGWNHLGWGSDVACQSDWLGRTEHQDWLGQPVKAPDCNWMGYHE